MDLGKCNILKHDIKITDPQPFKERYRRIPPHLYEEVKAHPQEMVEVGAIRRSFSPWPSAVVLVRKKDGILRFCIDLCKLNNRTVKDGYSLPMHRGYPRLLTWCSVVFHTGPELWILASGVRGGSQASNCIYHGSTWLLQNVSACPLDSPMPQQPFKGRWNHALVSCT